jgi:glycosyltransferase involved in cell wall biosynthesis
MSSSKPLVSGLLTTRDRPRFVSQAIRYFERQTYPNTELVVVDGGDHDVADLCAGRSRIHYVRATPGDSIGACLNTAAEKAHGDVLVKIDDDDYYNPAFVERAFDELNDSGELTVVAWDCFFVLLAGEKNLRFSGHGWSAGGTLCFRRAVWDKTRFRHCPGEDFFFLQESGAVIRRVCAPELFVLVRHGQNRWWTLGNTEVDQYFRSLPASGRRVDDVICAEDLAFYDAL